MPNKQITPRLWSIIPISNHASYTSVASVSSLSLSCRSIDNDPIRVSRMNIPMLHMFNIYLCSRIIISAALSAMP
jgi:hypothetical protein